MRTNDQTYCPVCNSGNPYVGLVPSCEACAAEYEEITSTSVTVDPSFWDEANAKPAQPTEMDEESFALQFTP